MRRNYKGFEMDRFNSKLKEFGWDKIDSNSTVKINKIKTGTVEYENFKMIDFIERYHFEGQFVVSSLYLYKGKELNKKLRNLLKDMGLYDFDIDPYIINGSDTTRIAILDNIDSKFLNNWQDKNMENFIKLIRNSTLILLLQLAFSQAPYAVSCIDAPNSLAFERCSEARAGGYSDSGSGFMSDLGRAFDEGARKSSRELAEMKNRGELNWFENTVMFIFYSLLVGFITALPKTAVVRIVLGLALFIPFSLRFWEFDYIMVILVFLTSFGFIASYSEEDQKDKRESRDEFEEYNRNSYLSDENYSKISPIQDIFRGKKSDLIKYAKKNDVTVNSRDTIDEILDKLAPINQANLLANLSKSELIKYAKCPYYDSNKDAMISGVMRENYKLSIEEIRADKALTRAQIIEKILQNKGRQEIIYGKTNSQITEEELQKQHLESEVLMLSEYPKLRKSELVEKLEMYDSELLNGLGLSYKKTDKKEVLLKNILTYKLIINKKPELVQLANKQGVSIKSSDTKAQIIEKIILSI